MKNPKTVYLSMCLLLCCLSGCSISSVEKKPMTPLEMYVAAERPVDMERYVHSQRISKMRSIELLLAPFLGVTEKVCGISFRYELHLLDWLLPDQGDDE